MTPFRQLFDPCSSSYTYLLADAGAREAVIIDCTRSQTVTVLALLDELGLRLSYALQTHVHDGEEDAAAALRARTRARAALGVDCGAPWADEGLRHGDGVVFGNQEIRVLGTPGHTRGCVSYLWQDRVFTGDALQIGGCGLPDPHSGDAGVLFDSITRRLFVLPAETLVYPAHDYRGRTVSTIGEERAHNPYFAQRTRDEFITLTLAQAALSRPEARGREGSSI